MRFTLGAKLILLIGFLLLSSELMLVGLSTHLFIQDNTALIQQMNADTALSIGTQVRAYLEGFSERMRLLGDVWVRETRMAESEGSVVRDFFVKNPEFMALQLVRPLPTTGAELLAEYYAIEGGSSVPRAIGEGWDLHSSEVQLVPARMGAGKGIGVAVPLSSGRHYLVGWINLSRMNRPFQAHDMAKGLEERDRVKETFAKYHNKELAETLLSGKVRLGGESKDAAILFIDLRDFTALTSRMPPEKVVEMLNEYFSYMVSVIRTYGGIVDKYVGDGIMALWGVPLERPDDAVRAVRCCLGIREELSRLNALRLSRHQTPLRIGMGLNLGRVIAGNIGSAKKMEYTVVGDAVNVASRIESLTKVYETDLLISRSVYERAARRFLFEPCRLANVRGKEEAIEVFRVLGYVDDSGRAIEIPDTFRKRAA